MRPKDHVERMKREWDERARPYVRAVPAPSGPRALYGCLEGLAEAKGDLTQPVDVKWEAARD